MTLCLPKSALVFMVTRLAFNGVDNTDLGLRSRPQLELRGLFSLAKWR